MARNKIGITGQFDDNISGKLGKIRDQFDRLGTSKGAKSILQGVGMGAGISAWNLMGAAVGKVTDFLGDSIKAAAEEEVGIARLNAALEANVKGWQGQTTVIEKGIKASERMGFADDAVRESLSRLVGSTHDVGKAFELMAVAQDLARKKGISLEDASTALIKVEGGQYRALKELGIVLKEGATATEALAEVQKVAGGQAAAYADTLAGKTAVLTTRFDNLQETVGGAVVPALADAADITIGLGDALDEVAAGGKAGDDALIGLMRAAATFTPFADAMNGKLDEASASLDSTREAFNEAAYAADTGTEAYAQYRDKGAGDVQDASVSIVGSNRKITRSFAGVTEYLLGEYNKDFDRALGIQEARADLHNAKTDQDRAQAYADLAELGAASKKDYAQWTAAMERLAKGTKGAVHEAYSAALEDLRRLRSQAGKPITVTVRYVSNSEDLGGGTGVGHRAAGGQASGLTWVGERGPELVDLGASSYVYTARQSQAIAAAGGMGGGVPVSIPIVLDGREIARVVDRHLYYEAARAPRSSYAG